MGNLPHFVSVEPEEQMHSPEFEARDKLPSTEMEGVKWRNNLFYATS